MKDPIYILVRATAPHVLVGQRYYLDTIKAQEAADAYNVRKGANRYMRATVAILHTQ